MRAPAEKPCTTMRSGSTPSSSAFRRTYWTAAFTSDSGWG
jgi:hypothetical protein